MRKITLLFVGIFTIIGTIAAQIDPDRVTTIGRNAIFFKDYVLAIQYFNTAIEAAPQRAESYYYRAVAKYNLDDYFGTEADCDSCILRNPFIYRAYTLRAIARQLLGKDSLALADYRVVLQNDPDDQGALHNSTLLHLALKDTISARRSLERLRRFYPQYAPSYVISGGMALERGDTLQAISLFKKGQHLAPESPNAYLSLASIAYQRGEFRKVTEYLDKGIQYTSDDPRLYTFRGLARFQLNDLKGAMQDYTTAIRIKPNDLLALYNRALLRTRVGEFDPAVEDFDRVLLFDPDNSFARYNRALIENNQGNYERALSDLDIIIDRYPTFAPAYIQRATAKRLLGKAREAEIDLFNASQIWNNPSYRNKKKRTPSGSSIENNRDEQDDTKETREEKDKNIRKFRMLVYDSRNKGYNEIYRESQGLRGRIQDRKAQIDPEPIYTLTYYTDADTSSDKLPKKYITPLQLPPTPYVCEISRRVPLLTPDVITLHRQRIDKHRQQQSHPDWALLMDQLTLRDTDTVRQTCLSLTESGTPRVAIEFVLGVLNVVDYTILSSTNDPMDSSENPVSTHKLSPSPSIKSGTPPAGYDSGTGMSRSLVKKNILEEAAKHFENVLTELPDLYPALYNLAYVRYLCGDYATAKGLLSKCIALEPTRGEAYFNRALCQYSLGEKSQGDRDMSKGGSLGVYRAYSILKQMQ